MRWSYRSFVSWRGNISGGSFGDPDWIEGCFFDRFSGRVDVFVVSRVGRGFEMRIAEVVAGNAFASTLQLCAYPW